MNIEVEIKIKVDSFEEIKNKLTPYGKLIKSIKQVDEYFVPCHRDFFAQKPHPVEWLRIRTNPDRVIFEYDKSINKKADGDQECADEYETEILQPEEFRKILEFLDFKNVITVSKQREYWDCGYFEVVLDDVDGLGLFLEVEAKKGFKDTIEAKEGCISFAKKLGIKDIENNHIKKGYPVLLLEKQSINSGQVKKVKVNYEN